MRLLESVGSRQTTIRPVGFPDGSAFHPAGGETRSFDSEKTIDFPTSPSFAWGDDELGTFSFMLHISVSASAWIFFTSDSSSVKAVLTTVRMNRPMSRTYCMRSPVMFLDLNLSCILTR